MKLCITEFCCFAVDAIRIGQILFLYLFLINIFDFDEIVQYFLFIFRWLEGIWKCLTFIWDFLCFDFCLVGSFRISSRSQFTLTLYLMFHLPINSKILGWTEYVQPLNYCSFSVRSHRDKVFRRHFPDLSISFSKLRKGFRTTWIWIVSNLRFGFWQLLE